MNTKELLDQINDDRILEAIAAAEKRSSGEIRVYISSSKIDNPERAAVERFEKLGMTRTKDRNGVLILVAPRSQMFAIVGDEGINTRCGADFWKHLAEDLTRDFQQEKYTDGIVRVIDEIGGVLGRYFPRRDDDRDELPDTVVRE